MSKSGRAIIGLLLFILAMFLVELLGNLQTKTTLHTWYTQLNKPWWTPPNWIFGPVWTLLYLLMAVAVWLIWRAPTEQSKIGAYALFWLQLFCNFIWSGLFFTLQNPGLALIDIVALVALLTGTIVAFYRIRPSAAYLLIPYWLWVVFATALNAAIWRLNSLI